MINEDELEFSGKENTWCLKLLLVIQQIQKSEGIDIEDHTKIYLEKLLTVDPLRKNRYKHLLKLEC